MHQSLFSRAGLDNDAIRWRAPILYFSIVNRSNAQYGVQSFTRNGLVEDNKVFRQELVVWSLSFEQGHFLH